MSQVPVCLFISILWQPEFVRNMYFTIEGILRELAVCVPELRYVLTYLHICISRVPVDVYVCV